MTQQNRAKLEVETLEDRITPAYGYLSSKLSALQATVHAKLSNHPSLLAKVDAQFDKLSSKISSLTGHTNGHTNGTSNGNSHTHTRICNALQHAYNKLVAIGAPQSVINKVAALQARFGCTT